MNRYIKSDSRIISLFLFPFILLKNLLFSNFKLAFKVVTIFGVIMAVIMSMFLVFQVNREASERYLIGKYEKNLSQLVKENQNLEVQFSKANAINGASGLAQRLNFEKIGQISYIKLANKVVKK